jgi:hypothetical protein
MRYPSCKKKQGGSPGEIRRFKQKGFVVKEVPDMIKGHNDHDRASQKIN